MDMGFDQRTQGPLNLRFAGLTELQASYMPYLHRGGLFIATGRRYRLGESVAATLSLAGHFEQLQIVGDVVWITPAGAQGNRAAGVGVHFSADEAVQHGRLLIEGLLAQHGLPMVASYTM
ncbi:PilZ domain-containing protein [Frateuria aurantia]